MSLAPSAAKCRLTIFQIQGSQVPVFNRSAKVDAALDTSSTSPPNNSSPIRKTDHRASQAGLGLEGRRASPVL
jgi:hypothetical protein